MAPVGIPQFLRGQLLQTCPVPTTDLSGRTMIITGANCGLGLDAAKHLIRLKASRLILACRSVSKGEKAREEILAHGVAAAHSSSSSSSSTASSSSSSSSKATTNVEVWPLDLTSYASVLAFADRCNHDLDRLDAVIENAGVSLIEFTRAEDDETTITVNVISTFLLALLLLPKLRESARRHNILPHLVIVGSAVHFWADENQLLKPPEGQILASLSDPQTADMPNRYFLSKLLIMQGVRELAAGISASASSTTPPPSKPFIVVNVAAPGWCRTSFFRYRDQSFGEKVALRLIGRSSEEGSRTLVHAATTAESQESPAAGAAAGAAAATTPTTTSSHGQYLSECQVKPASPFVRSADGARVQKLLWRELLAKLERISPGIGANI